MNNNTYKKILEYSLWYYQTYRVSIKKLELKVREKFGIDSDSFQGILSEISIFINEREDIENIISWYKYKRKSIFYIVWKLYERFYTKDLIEDAIGSCVEDVYEEMALKRELLTFSKDEIVKNKQKIISSYISKWFSFSLVNRVMCTL